MTKLNKNNLKDQESFALEEVAALLEEEGKNVGQYIKDGYLKIGEDLKVQKNDFAFLIDHIIKSKSRKLKISPSWAFASLWVSTIVSFILTIDTRSPIGRTYSQFSTSLVLANIMFGIIAFLLMLFSRKLFKESNLIKYFKVIPLISLVYLLFYTTVITADGHGLVASFTEQHQGSALQNKSGASIENIWKAEIIAKVNTERQKEDLTPLFESELLDKSSEARAKDIFDTNSWEIKPKNGKDFSYFIKEAGYNSEYSGESLARNYYDTSSIISSLMTDKTNKDNILSKNFKDIGVTVKEGFLSDQKKIIVIHFGSPITPTTTSKPSQKTVYNDPDPFIDCESTYPNCKGTSIRVHNSQCSKITCCQVGTTWSIYPSSEKCNEAQKNFQSQQAPAQNTIQNTSQPSANKVPVFISYGGYTVYCPSQNVGAVQSIASTMESKKNQWASDYNKCADNFYKTDSCYISCSNTNKNDLDICYAAYGYSGDNSSACTKEVWDNYSKCISSCPSASKSCDYVYWEQKNLSSQITNLCK